MNVIRLGGLLFVLGCLSPVLAFADDEFSGFEDSKVVAEESKQGPQNVSELIAHLHPSVVHLPIAWLLLLILSEWLGLIFGKEVFANFGAVLLPLTVLSFVPAAVSGFLNLASELESKEEMDLALFHRNLMLFSCALCVIAWVLRLRFQKAWTAKTRWFYVGLLTAAGVAVSVGGHLGGKLVYGENYLPF